MFNQNHKKTIFIKISNWVLPIMSLTLVYLAYISFVSKNSIIMPYPSEIWERFVRTIEYPIKNVTIFGHVWASLKRVFIAAFVSWMLGIPFGIIIGWNRKMRAVFGTIFDLLRPIPPIAWIPLIVLLFGIGEFSKILVVFIGCFIPITVNTSAGIAMTEKEYTKVGRIFGCNETQLLWHIVLPGALPSIFTGVHLTISAGWRVVLAAEMLAADYGIGSIVTRGWSELDMALVLCSIICIALVGATLSLIVEKLERLLTPWNR